MHMQMQRVKQVQRKHKESKIRLMAKNDWAFSAKFSAIIPFRLQTSEERIYAYTFFTDWFRSNFITASMYSQCLFTVFC